MASVEDWPGEEFESGARTRTRARFRVHDEDPEGLSYVHQAIYRATVAVTVLFLVALIAYFVLRAFRDDLGTGVRSFSSVLLPVMVLTALTRFRKQELENAEVQLPGALTFVVTLIIGIGVLALLTMAPNGIPVQELVLSGCLSILLFSSLILPADRAMFYYFGMVIGFLLYVMILGFPQLGG